MATGPIATVPIVDEDELYRRIHPTHVKDDGSFSSAAFRGADSHELSVDLARLCTPEDTYSREGPGYAGVVALTAGAARQCSQRVEHNPLIDNPAHALIIGNKTTSIARKLAKASRWVYQPSSAVSQQE